MRHGKMIDRTLRRGLLLGAMVMSLATPAMAVVDIVMRIDGVTGENCFDQAHQNWSCVLGTSFGTFRSCTPQPGGEPSCGNPNFSDFVVSKVYDSTSPQLLSKLVQHTVIPAVEIEWWRSGEAPIQVAEVLLEGVVVSSISAGGASGEDVPTESVTFVFSKITSTVWPVTNMGTQGPPQTTCWNVATNGPC